jgi:phosphate transport system protein
MSSPLIDAAIYPRNILNTMLPNSYDNNFIEIKNHLDLLANLVERVVLDSLAALRTRNIELSKNILERDREIYKKRYFLQEEVAVQVVRRQPTERDLQFTIAVFNIADKMERIGDYAHGIALINLRSHTSLASDIFIELTQMALKATSILRRALHAIHSEDFELAIQISRENNEIDLLYKRTYDELIKTDLKESGRIKEVNHLFGIANKLERLNEPHDQNL